VPCIECDEPQGAEGNGRFVQKSSKALGENSSESEQVSRRLSQCKLDALFLILYVSNLVERIDASEYVNCNLLTSFFSSDSSIRVNPRNVDAHWELVRFLRCELKGRTPSWRTFRKESSNWASGFQHPKLSFFTLQLFLIFDTPNLLIAF